MKKLAVRDWEDILQCCMPCFDGLFPDPHSHDVSVIVYTLAQWHALAKLRLHTNATLDALDAHTTVLGRRLRRCKKSSAIAFKTTETDREFNARRRRLEKKAASSAGSSDKSTVSVAQLPKEFSLTTYKLHALGDYPLAIKNFGTTDSFSTQNGELEHRHVKSHGRRTNQQNIAQDVGVLERREARLHQREAALKDLSSARLASSAPEASASEVLESDEREEETSPESHYTISIRGETIRLIDFYQIHRNNPAIKASFQLVNQGLLLHLRAQAGLYWQPLSTLAGPTTEPTIHIN
ncbi:hypothetical protein FRC07_005586 [Ceratobasidium sp. 392]|nr:hypothetical protein FRC07_005586 [Ceratobasidium sp. 392]